MGDHGSMRSGPAAHDPAFRGIDPAALEHLISQLNAASSAIRGWLGSHRPPPGVSTTGYRQAAEVERWATDQIGMLSRRHSYAVTHPDSGGGVTAPPVPRHQKTPRSNGTNNGTRPAPKDPPRLTPRGAGGDPGNFPNRQAARKAAKADALAVSKALKEHRPIPDSVWRHLKENADDPDYTAAFYERLGPQGLADLIKAAHGDKERLAVIRESLGTASHHMRMDVVWMKELLASAEHGNVRAVTLDLLTHAHLSPQARAALSHLREQPLDEVSGRIPR